LSRGISIVYLLRGDFEEGFREGRCGVTVSFDNSIELVDEARSGSTVLGVAVEFSTTFLAVQPLVWCPFIKSPSVCFLAKGVRDSFSIHFIAFALGNENKIQRGRPTLAF
jgi:hypothetical protein